MGPIESLQKQIDELRDQLHAAHGKVGASPWGLTADQQAAMVGNGHAPTGANPFMTAADSGAVVPSGMSFLSNADGWQGTGGTAPRTMSITGGALAITAPAAGATFNLAGNFTTTGAFNTTFVAGASVTLTLPPVASWLVGSTGTAMTVTGLSDGFQLSGGTAARTFQVTGGDATITSVPASVNIHLAGNLTTTVGAVALAAASAGGSSVTLPTSGTIVCVPTLPTGDGVYQLTISTGVASWTSVGE